jgi:alpha-glucosidase
LLGRKFFPDEIVAAAAIVAASLPRGENIRRALADQAYDVQAVQVPAPDQELTTSALQALLFAAGPDGPWHDGWVNPEDAAQARRTTNQLTAILREQHSQDQELPPQN